jgi:hypothetical protein
LKKTSALKCVSIGFQLKPLLVLKGPKEVAISITVIRLHILPEYHWNQTRTTIALVKNTGMAFAGIPKLTEPTKQGQYKYL